MIREDYHVHTTFCDGKATPEELVRAAVEKGMTRLGLVVHSYTDFDVSYCLPRGTEAVFQRAVAALKEQYCGRLELFCGVEQDRYSTAPTTGFDYVIGAAHYVYVDGIYLPVDGDPRDLEALVRKHFEGDWYALAEAYFRTVAEVPEATGAHILGHFDLVAKYNEGNRYFEEQHPRYVAAWQKAADRLLAYDRPFEINTGSLFRSGRSQPYPARAIQRYLATRGGRAVLSSDSHTADTLCGRFDEWEKEAFAAGFPSI